MNEDVILFTFRETLNLLYHTTKAILF